ncbi:MAG: hypothetical protein U5P41_03550 [Gammaproteobacteria bacterium]|nr:hypothetical protein [Gammaproteobacteria bacterium]
MRCSRQLESKLYSGAEPGAGDTALAAVRWMREPMFLGLDLRGGVHFLLEVDMEAAVQKAEERYISDIRGLLREERVRYKSVAEAGSDGILVRLRDQNDMETADNLISREFPELNLTESSAADEYRLTGYPVRTACRARPSEFALQQNITTLRKRVNELGVAEPVIQQQGSSRIVVQLPGVQDTARAKDILGATATLEFRMVDQDNSAQDAVDGKVPAGSKLYYDRSGQPLLLEREIMLTGDSITDASSGIDQRSGGPAVYITLDGKGARMFSRRTSEEVGNPMATVYIENKSMTVARR